MSEIPTPEKQKFDPAVLNRASLALTKGHTEVAISILGQSPTPEVNETVVSTANAIKFYQLFAEALAADPTLHQLTESQKHCKEAFKLVKSLPEGLLRKTYEVAVLCTAAEIERVQDGGINPDSMMEIVEIVDRIPADNPFKSAFEYYSKRTLGLSLLQIDPEAAKACLTKARLAQYEYNATYRAGIPRDGVLELDKIGEAKLSTLRAQAPHPLSTICDLPTRE